VHDALGEIPLTSPECLKLAVCKLQDNIGAFPQDKLRVFRALSRMGRRLNALAEEVHARLRDHPLLTAKCISIVVVVADRVHVCASQITPRLLTFTVDTYLIDEPDDEAPPPLPVLTGHISSLPSY